MASKLTTTFRVLLGVLFLFSGGVKLPKLGQAVVPDAHKQMAKDFGRFLRVAPFKSMVKLTSLQYMTIVGYVEMTCGFLLLSNQLTALASIVLVGQMIGATYTLNALKEPLQMQAFPAALGLMLFYVACTCSGKKKEKSE